METVLAQYAIFSPRYQGSAVGYAYCRVDNVSVFFRGSGADWGKVLQAAKNYHSPGS